MCCFGHDNTLETRWTVDIFDVVSWIYFHFITRRWRFLNRQIVTMNKVTLFMQHNRALQVFCSRNRHLEANERRQRN